MPSISSILQIITPPQFGIRVLIWNLLVLDEQLQNVEKQSIYFRWAVDAQRERLERLKIAYERTRQEFNRLAVDELLERITAEETFVIPVSFPVFGKNILQSRRWYLIGKYRDYISLKSMVDALPPYPELKESEVLEKILASPV